MTEKFVTLPREVLEQALNALDAGVKISPNSVLHDRLRAALEQPQGEQEPVGYEYVEHRPYGAPGEIRRCTILLEHYRNADGAIAEDWEWLVQQFKTSKNTISMRPLYTQPQPQAEQEPLTDEAVLGVAKSIEIQFDSERLNEQIDDILAFARAIEAAHNIK